MKKRRKNSNYKNGRKITANHYMTTIPEDMRSLLLPNAKTEYEVRDIVCDYAVYAKHKEPEPHEELLVICNSRTNAELIRDIMQFDSAGERYPLAYTREELIQLAETNQSNEVGLGSTALTESVGKILEFLSDKYKADEIGFNPDGGLELLKIEIKGKGRMTPLSDSECDIINSMQIMTKIEITRKINGKVIWSRDLSI